MRTTLLAWYRVRRRDLPWRRTADPYAIWVSEIMLQQTTVAAVVPHYGRFLRRFPDVTALAAASEDEVLAAWSGLGYYGRARNLRAAAREIEARHGGRIPDDPGALRALPGIGPYTAGAIASVAFGRPEPVVDGNVRRVLARLHAREDPPERELWARARDLVRGPDPGDLNQALMELGATVCTPRVPACPACPIAAACEAHRSGSPERFPRPPRRRPAQPVEVQVALVVRRGRVLLESPRAEGNPLRGSAELPAFEGGDGLVAAFRARHGAALRPTGVPARAVHTILHRRLHLSAVPAQVSGRAGPGLLWAPLAELDERPVSGATRKLLAAAGLPAGKPGRRPSGPGAR